MRKRYTRLTKAREHDTARLIPPIATGEKLYQTDGHHDIVAWSVANKYAVTPCCQFDKENAQMDTATAATRRVDLIKSGSEYAFDTRDADAPDHTALLIPGGRNQTRNVMRMKHAFAAYQKNTDTFFGHECMTSKGDNVVIS